MESPSFHRSLLDALESAGERFLRWLDGWRRVFWFAGQTLATALSPACWDMRMRDLVARQIYFTAWQILPGFILITGLASFAVIRLVAENASTYGVAAYALSISVNLLVLELIPLFVALFVALRSGSAINTEVVLMHIGGALDDPPDAPGDAARRELVPRVVASAFSVLALTVLGGSISLALTYFALFGFSPWGFYDFTRSMGHIFDPVIVIGMGLKSLFFGLAVAVIPITASLESPRELKLAPIAVLNGMVRLFLTVALIQGLWLGLKSL